MKVSKRCSGVLIGAIVSTVISCIISGYVTWRNLGLSDEFLVQWHEAFLGAWPLAFLLAIVITPLAKYLVDNITE